MALIDRMYDLLLLVQLYLLPYSSYWMFKNIVTLKFTLGVT